ncbi:hypothetical protein ACJX0J_019971, partial [Zea mays]
MHRLDWIDRSHILLQELFSLIIPRTLFCFFFLIMQSEYQMKDIVENFTDNKILPNLSIITHKNKLYNNVFLSLQETNLVQIDTE